ncbi:MAG: transcription-repair coupling factor [Candidatus Gastranaerophilales bacterium]|nr:transcription-repair coupling factor [Candidatus Gastranaerophilales bacterium]
MNNNPFDKFIFDTLDNAKVVKSVINKLELNSSLALSGLSSTAKAVFVYYLSEKLNKPVFFVSSTISKALNFYNKFNLISQDENSYKYFEPQETSPYQLVYSDGLNYKNELENLRDFKNNRTKILTTNANSLLTLYNTEDYFEKNSIVFEKKKEFDFDSISDKLVTLGYRREAMVNDVGEFSLRGDILDIYPVNDSPVRIEFWGDETESIRYFDINSQMTTRLTDKVTVNPAYKLVINDTKKLKEKLIKNFEIQKKGLSDTYKESFEFWFNSALEALEEEKYFEGIEYFSSFLNPKMNSIFDFMPENVLIIFDEAHEILAKCELLDHKLIAEYERNITEGLALKLNALNHLEFKNLQKELARHNRLSLNSFIDFDVDNYMTIDASLLPRFDTNSFELGDFTQNELRNRQNIIITTQYPARIEEILKEQEVPVKNGGKLEANCVNIIKSELYEGFASKDLNLVLITDVELFNRKIKKPTIAKKLSKKENIDFIYSINDLKENDLVVHSMHGIGRYLGLSQQEIDGELKDYLSIEYANSDRLYIPAEQINMLSRYRGSNSIPPKLSKMGGGDWNSTKSKVKKAIDNIAEDLLRLYARRAKQEGFAFFADTLWQMEMEDAFLYTETPDQMQAIIDTKNDMEAAKPMDRLICGDVGFGKTEVALRAVFKAVMSGKQAAFLAPTTILAQQHYQSLKERFAPFAVKIELLSRLKTPKETKNILKETLNGECDVVIGTHRLLQKDVEFKNLGLVIVDEEHRFGVAHKEKLKQYRSNVDVLSLSATPIPRTLYMSMSGVRDMSLINTPPVNRLPVKTFVGEYNPAFAATAINYEIEREGQVYVLYNRVQSIYKFAEDIKKLVPNARIAVAHGQMPPKELESVIYDFSVNNYDVLVCTTIIESGIDIPNANTILIYDADKFGLAQLYQLRGRIGRSDRQAYAYCFYRKDKVITQEAVNRLNAIKDFTTLGSGYQIAMRDLEIRGVGNILGSQQHGHMVSVGFDVYCDMLEEAVRTLQGEKVEKKETPVIDINITAYIPDDYVNDKQQKMIEYKRLADTKSIKELEMLRFEWIDRFGKIPDVVEPLLQIIKLRLLAADISVKSVKETFSDVKIYSDYSKAEWQIITKNMDYSMLKNLRFTENKMTNAASMSVIHIDNSKISPKELLDLLEYLFYYIKELQESIFTKEQT